MTLFKSASVMNPLSDRINKENSIQPRRKRERKGGGVVGREGSFYSKIKIATNK